MRLPPMVDILLSQPCLLIRFVSFGRGKYTRIFDLTGTNDHAPPEIWLLIAVTELAVFIPLMVDILLHKDH